MPRAQQSGLQPSSSAGSLKRPFSPDLMPAPGSSIPVAKSRSHPSKRAKATLTEAVKTPPTPDIPSISKPILPQPTVVHKPDTSTTSPQVFFSGNFDLYGMYLPFLAKAYLPQGETTPDYAAVYDKILTCQAKHDYTARCFLAPPVTSSSADGLAPAFGRFESATIVDPMLERPFDLNLGSFTHKKSLTFTPTERTSLLAPQQIPHGPGVIGQTGLPGKYGVKSSRGVFKMRRVWVTTDERCTKELYEGFFSFSVSYGGMYHKAGHGNGAMYKFAFWGVRALKDNMGKEIGLGPRTLK